MKSPHKCQILTMYYQQYQDEGMIIPGMGLYLDENLGKEYKHVWNLQFPEVHCILYYLAN